MKRVQRRGTHIGACLVALGLLAGACGSGTGLEADGPSTSIGGRFPAAVVPTSTTGVPKPPGTPSATTTSTTRKVSSSGTATTTTSVTSGPAPRVRPAATPMPAPRSALGGVGWQGLVVVAGGFDASGNPSARVDAYDPVTGAWQRGPDLPDAIRDAGLVVLGDDLYLVGGFTRQGDQPIALATTYVFRPGGTAWKQGPNLKTARGAPGVATLGNTLVAFGGQTTDGGTLESVETLTVGDDAWKDGPPLSQKRAYASAVVTGGRVYAVGGRVGGVSTALSATESWKPGDADWRSEANLSDARSGAAGAGACVAGGENADGAVASIECAADRKWSSPFQMAVPRHGLAAVIVDGWLHLVGGGPRPGPTVNSAHEVFDLT